MPASPEHSAERGFIIPIGGAECKGKNPAILSRFVALCGGKNARIMVIPTASLLNETGPQYEKLFRSMGAKSMCVPIEKREDCFDGETIRIYYKPLFQLFPLRCFTGDRANRLRNRRDHGQTTASQDDCRGCKFLSPFD